MKVGSDVDADVRRVERLAARHPDVDFILDANQAANLNPFRDLQYIRRVAVLDKILPIA